MQMNKEQMQLMKELEIRLHFALQTIEALNKNVHCDNGQEYPVPVIDKNGSVEFFK
jgi:hypothetical protein